MSDAAPSSLSGLDLVADALMRAAVRKMLVLMVAAPLVGLATFFVVGGASFVLPAIVAAMPLLGLVRIALQLRDRDRHPVIVALREDPLIIKKVMRDERPIGVIKWRLATSHLVQVELAGEPRRHVLAFPDEASMKAGLELFRARATRAEFDQGSGVR